MIASTYRLSGLGGTTFGGNRYTDLLCDNDEDKVTEGF